jgi:anaerobic magnesium-protoporphyrin IX monomethyl ester cyclase
MNLLLINPPYQTITSNLGVGHQVPLGLLMIGGALIDAGHQVRLLDAERLRLSIGAIVKAVRKWRPDVIMTGHAGSTPAHPVTMRMLRAIKAEHPDIQTIYGGVYPSYYAEAILREHSFVDYIIRGEGEAAAVELIDALSRGAVNPQAVSGVYGRRSGRVVAGESREPIKDLDAYRIGWELIDDWDRYQCFGLGRAAIIQFSRGCPHRCTYCGQHEFWRRWRHRDPIKVVDEIQFLRRRHNVRFITFADENPTTRQDLWKALLTELAGRDLGVHFFATIRATDIVRDAELLPLYRAAGMLYVLMGIESTSDQILREVRKGSSARHDFQACRLLKQHGIFSIIGYIVGLGDESPRRFRTTLEQLKHYNGDWLNAMYVTPHDWTPFGQGALRDPPIETDLSQWDYRHQVLPQRRMSRARLFFHVKWLELAFHCRPARVWQAMAERDPLRRRQQLWTYAHTGAVWMAEIAAFILRAAGRARRGDRQQLPAPVAAPARRVSLVVSG